MTKISKLIGTSQRTTKNGSHQQRLIPNAGLSGLRVLALLITFVFG